MIFVTIGTQLPFDRLIRAVDQWAPAALDEEVVAQIGPGLYTPRHMRWARFFDVAECDLHTRNARLIIAHAGMGSVLTALQLGKPILIVPRRAELGEHRNDHQMATARRLVGLPGVRVVFDIERLGEVAGQCLGESDHVAPIPPISDSAPPQLLEVLRNFVQEGPAMSTSWTFSFARETSSASADASAKGWRLGLFPSLRARGRSLDSGQPAVADAPTDAAVLPG